MLTAVLVFIVAALLRGAWSLQARISRLEGMDEMRERRLDDSRRPEKPVKPFDWEED